MGSEGLLNGLVLTRQDNPLPPYIRRSKSLEALRSLIFKHLRMPGLFSGFSKFFIFFNPRLEIF